MGREDMAGHGPDDPLTATERAALLAWARAHPDSANHLAAVLVLRYETALAAVVTERDQARSALEEHRIAYTALTGERDELQHEMDQGCAGMLLVAHALGVYSAMGKGPWPPWEVLRQRAARLAAQIDRLANFIMQEIPGEPSQSEGAVDTAIRLLSETWRKDAKNATIEPTV